MIVLFTDFGLEGPYVGQMKMRLHNDAPGISVIDLMHDVPAFDVEGAAHLLAAYGEGCPARAVVLGVVDPGVGGARRAIAVEADGRWYVGPDNGLFEIVMRRALDRSGDVHAFEIVWRPGDLSASFHGRDLFAPIAAWIATGVRPDDDDAFAALDTAAVRRPDWVDDLTRVIHLDRYGNAVTGVRASTLEADAVVEIAGQRIPRARTFSDVMPGVAFWYENANGLVEIAVNQGRAADLPGLGPGGQVRVTKL